MTKSKSMWGVALLLLLWALLQVRYFNDTFNWSSLSMAIASISACLGIILEKKWGAWLVHLVGSSVILLWLVAVWHAIGDRWPYPDALRDFLSLVPGLAMVGTCLVLMLVVHRHFRCR
jgi:hypothetical protein